MIVFGYGVALGSRSTADDAVFMCQSLGMEQTVCIDAGGKCLVGFFWTGDEALNKHNVMFIDRIIPLTIALEKAGIEQRPAWYSGVVDE